MIITCLCFEGRKSEALVAVSCVSNELHRQVAVCHHLARIGFLGPTETNNQVPGFLEEPVVKLEVIFSALSIAVRWLELPVYELYVESCNEMIGGKDRLNVCIKNNSQTKHRHSN